MGIVFTVDFIKTFKDTNIEVNYRAVNVSADDLYYQGYITNLSTSGFKIPNWRATGRGPDMIYFIWEAKGYISATKGPTYKIIKY